MKNFIILLISLMLVSSIKSLAQEDEKEFGIKFSGYIKSDFFFDTRQTIAAREGHFLLWPSPEVDDVNGNDINAKSSFNFLAIQSRLNVTINGPEAFGAKTSGTIESDFFAQSNANINLMRLRHAYIKLIWGKTELMAGQYWNPMFVTKCFPGTVSFNTGTPFQSFARNPQLRLTQKVGHFDLMIAALSQRDYSTYGINPSNSVMSFNCCEFLRNSSVPDMHIQALYNMGNGFLLGTGGEYKTIVPRLSSRVGNDTYKVNERLGSFSAMAFASHTSETVTFKLQGRYGENISDMLTVSGFAVKEVLDPVTGESSYTPLQNVTVWGEIHTNGKKVQLGVFGGYLQNLGTKEEMSEPTNLVYGLGHTIASMYRVSPRIIFISNNTKFACEIEHTAAAYGSGFDENYLPANTNPVFNTRVLLSAVYAF